MPGEYTQPYKHATKLFVADTYRLAPKQAYLYYVVFEVDPSQTELGSGLLNSTLEFANRYNQLETGMLVKDIELPKFNISTKTLNAYNRKNIIQTNITYDPISVTFHDDAANVITKFWNDYYTYYYRDSDYTSASYGVQDKYSRRRLSGWGYSPRDGATTTFLKSIRIFSLHNKNFTEYYLVNPVINSWRHGRHETGSNTGILENVMTISYETVKYYTGFTNPVNVDGFSLLHYDNQKSPIAGDFLGDIDTTGAINLISGAPKDLRKPDGSQGAGGPLSSILTAYRTYQNLKNVDLRSVAGASLAVVGTSVINDVINGRVAFPTDTTNSSRVFTNRVSGLSTTYADGGSSSRITNAAGTAVGVVIGGAINSNATNLDTLGTSLARGIANSLSGTTPASGNLTKVYDVVESGNGVFINPGSMQPQTGSYTAYVTDNNGKTISEFTVSGSSTGGYDSTNASLNLRYSQITTNDQGQDVIRATYNDGTQVTFDATSGNTINIVQGSEIYKQLGYNADVNSAPSDTRSLIAAGQTVATTATQVITNTATGVVSTVGGIVTGRVVDLGTAAGTLLGSRLGGSAGAAVGGIIGRSLATQIATRSGNQIGAAISGGLKPVIDKITGSITQGIEGIAGGIKNVVGSWTGTGGFNPAAPYDNLVSTVYGSDGSVTEIFKNGDRLVTAGDSVELIKGSDTLGTSGFWNRITGTNIDSSASAMGAGYGSIWTDGSGNPILSGDNQYIFSGGDASYLGSVNYGFDQADYLGSTSGLPWDTTESTDAYSSLVSFDYGSSADFDVDVNFGDWSW